MTAADFTPERIAALRTLSAIAADAMLVYHSGPHEIDVSREFSAMLDAIEELQADNAELRGLVEQEFGTEEEVAEFVERRLPKASLVALRGVPMRSEYEATPVIAPPS